MVLQRILDIAVVTICPSNARRQRPGPRNAGDEHGADWKGAAPVRCTPWLCTVAEASHGIINDSRQAVVNPNPLSPLIVSS
jgi:hypothetical protein